ncbi:MAG TPA: hypothetical protein VGC91_00820 [Pyrinomonadaceae bacterium]
MVGIDNKLLKLRLVVYTLAAAFHHLMAEYFSALHHRADTSKVTKEIFDAGTKYLLALDELLQHLHTLPPTAEIVAEIERTRRILALLDIEMGLLRG